MEPEQWLQRHPEAGSSWPCWPHTPPLARQAHQRVGVRFLWDNTVISSTLVGVSSTRMGVSITPVGVSNTLVSVSNTLTGVSNPLVRVSNTLVGVSDTPVTVPQAHQRVGVRFMWDNTVSKPATLNPKP